MSEQSSNQPPLDSPLRDAPVTRAHLASIDFEAMVDEEYEQIQAQRRGAARARRLIAERTPDLPPDHTAGM